MTAPTRSLAPAREAAALPRAACELPSPAPAVRQRRERVALGFANAAERATVLAWLDAGLRPGRAGGLAREYPLLWAPGSRALPITVWSGTRPASFCMLWPVRFDLPGGALRAGLVSLVYTDPAARGRGLARRALAGAVDAARERALGLVLLWSELDAFYATQGFTPAGAERLLALDGGVLSRALAAAREADGCEAGARDPAGLAVAAASAADWEAIAELRSQRACGLRFGREAYAALARIPGLEVRVARDARGVTAFAMQGRGEDFSGVVHEWGGDPSGVLRCLSAWLPDPADPTKELLLLAPTQRSSLTGRLCSAGARSVERPLAWMRIAAPTALARDLAPLVPSLAARALELDGAALLALLFSPASDPAHAAARARVAPFVPRAELARLPLPFFVWGLESI